MCVCQSKFTQCVYVKANLLNYIMCVCQSKFTLYSPDVNSSTEVQIQVAIVRRPDSSTVRLPRQYVSPIAR
jgi:hypothetical protein